MNKKALILSILFTVLIGALGVALVLIKYAFLVFMVGGALFTIGLLFYNIFTMED